MSFYLKTEMFVYGEKYECHCIEQAGRAKGTRYKAYGYFKNSYLEAQASSASDALDRLKRKAEITLD